MTDGFDNTLGDPIFQPELTGAGLPGASLADWIAFCTAVVEADSAIYNTWFENRWMRADEKAGGLGMERAKCVVRATEHHGMICIRCPTKVGAGYLRDHMKELRGLSRRRFYVLGPNEDPPKPFDPAQCRADITKFERLAQEHPLKHYQRLADAARAELARRETADRRGMSGG